MEDIPLIDLQPQFENHAKETEIVKQIGEACENNGFFAVRGHGISEKVIEHCWQVSHDFFALAAEEKQKVKMPFAGYPYGFARMEAETLSLSRGRHAPPDLKENFSVGPNANPPAGISSDEALFVFSENQWPQNPVNFQQAWETCYEAMSLLSMRLMKLFALALKLPQNYFDGFLQQPISALRANHYPTLNKAVLPGQMRAGEHSDYGSLTLLFQEEGSSGLEILNHQKEWIPVTPSIPNLVVNLGDLMEHWTNGRWISTLHRVVAPQNKKDLAQSRMSLAFFQQPDWYARIECLPTCIDYDKTSKYPVLTSGKYLMERFQSTVVNET